MKKKTKEWIKEQLITFLEQTNQTIISSTYSYKKGIGERPSYYKNHYNQNIEEYLNTKFHLQCEEKQTKLFFDYLLQNKQGNEEKILEFFKSKSPTNKTKVEKNSIIKIEDSSNDYYIYQKYIVSILTDQDMLFDYIGNLKFLYSNQDISFYLIENVFDKKKKETLIEMYLNSTLMKNIEFERKLFLLLEKINLKDKYIEYFPNLKKGKKNFDLDFYDNKQTGAFIITFDKETLIQQIETNKSINLIFNNIDYMINLKEIPELKIDILNILTNKNKKTVVFLGDNLNIDYIKVAIKEYMKISIKEEKDFASINYFVYNKNDFNSDKGLLNKQYQEAFINFKERIQKIYLKEKLDKNLIKNETIKVKFKKI